MLKKTFILTILIWACIFTVNAKSYYQTSGIYTVTASSLDILDYPDSRASAAYTLHSGDTIHTSATSGQDFGANSFLCKLLEPTSAWMALRLPDGKLGFVWRDNTKMEKIHSEEAPITTESIENARTDGKAKYTAQAKTHLKWIGFALIGMVILMIVSKVTDNALVGLLSGVALMGFMVAVLLYFIYNPHSMWFVSPSIVGWGTTILCIIPTFIVGMMLFGEFVGSIQGVIKNPVNILSAVILGAVLFFFARAIYLEVADLISIMILCLSGAGIRTSSEYGTLVDQATGKFITGVRFSGNKAYSDKGTFTNNGSGYFE